MTLTVLSDNDVRSLLLKLSQDDIYHMQQSLADALHYYSTATEDDDNGCCSANQPLRTVLAKKDGTTTLFMPASSNDGLGVKIVTLQQEVKGKDGSVTSSMTDLSIGNKSQHKSSVDSSSASTSTFGGPPGSMASFQSTTPRGSLTLLDKNGYMRALVNAEEITAFRTALASTLLFKKRDKVHDITVFGAGKQAYWHIRLALLLRGREIHHINVVNRSFETAHQLIERLYNPDRPAPAFPTITAHKEQSTELARPKYSILTPGHTEYDRLLKEYVRSANVLFCTTPSLAPLFPASYLTSTEGRKKGRYIAAIGSYKPHMVELHPDILRQAVKPEHSHRHFHRHAKQGGAVVVDSVEACLKEAGEVIQAGLKGDEVVELGELVMLKRDAEQRRKDHIPPGPNAVDADGVELDVTKSGRRRKSHGQQTEAPELDEAEKSLKDWLERGNVIYKSVGLGLMDVVIGGEIVRLADEKGVGTRIENF